MTDEEIINVSKKSITMSQAARLCGMSYRKFAKKAKELGCFKPNPSGKGLSKEKQTLEERKSFLLDILDGKHPHYQTYKLKLLLLKFGLIEDKCLKCGWKEKPQGAKITPCELDHIDGNPFNHSLNNLQLLCPNCHSLTKTYRFRRGKSNEQLGRKLLAECRQIR